MPRYIVLDTETTGLRWSEGHRVFEIGMVETRDLETIVAEKNIFINPQVDLSEESMEICKVTNEELKVHPSFEDIAQEFLDFLYLDHDSNERTVILAHNAKFDIGFLNYELSLCGKPQIGDDFVIIDTVKMAKMAYPGQAANLDQLCKRFEIDLKDREERGHGAMLDSRLLCEVVFRLTPSKGYYDVVNFDKVSENFVGFVEPLELFPKRSFDNIVCDIDAHNAVLEKLKVSDKW